MKLVERGGAEVGKTDFLRWREEGLAYNLKEEGMEEVDEAQREDNMTLVSRGKVGQLGYYGDIVTGPFICLGTKRKSEWSIQDQQKEGNKERHVMLVRDRVQQLVRQLEGLRSSSSEPNILVKPLGLPGPAAGGLEGLARVGKGLDTAWVRDLMTIYLLVTYFQVGVSMTHLVTPKLGELISSGGTLVTETPLFLLQVVSSFNLTFIFAFPQLTDDQLAAFKEKAQELASLAGLQSLDQDCDPCKDTFISFVKG